MAVPLPHAPPSSGMHPCAAPCTQRRLGADTLWSRKPKACGPPTMALAPLTPPLPPECISAHSQADSGLRYWSWDSSKRLHQIFKDACASTPSGTCCARLQVATVGTSTVPFPQVPVGTKMPPLLHPIPLVGAVAAPQRSIPTPQDTYWLSSRSRVKAEPKARTTKLTCARCTPCKRVAAVRHGRLRAPSAGRNPIGIVKNHSLSRAECLQGSVGMRSS